MSITHIASLTHIRNHLVDATTIGDLLLWIENARALLQRIQHLSETNNTFQDFVKDYSLMVNSAIWEQDESDALILLHLHMRRCINEAGKIAQGGAV
jgi:hypothetical protein